LQAFGQLLRAAVAGSIDRSLSKVNIRSWPPWLSYSGFEVALHLMMTNAALRCDLRGLKPRCCPAILGTTKVVPSDGSFMRSLLGSFSCQLQKRWNVERKRHVVMPANKQRKEDMNHRGHQNCQRHILNDFFAVHPQRRRW